MPFARRRSAVVAPVVALVALVAVVAAGCTSNGRGTGAARELQVQQSTTTTVAPITTTTAAPTTTTAAPAPAAPAWAPCQNGFECATLNPPLDYDNPDGRTTKLAIIRLKASGLPAARIGALLVNPGGPGASAVSLARNARNFIRPSLLARFDVVAFDPRGTGGSNAIVCDEGPNLDRYFSLDPTPDTPAERQQLVDGSRTLAEQCAARVGDLLGHIDTRTAARDMDYVRAALGEEQVSYMGFSYGTFLGAMYADLFPNRVRAFVLDGAIDPSLDVDQINEDQAVGFEASFNAFLDDCAGKLSCPLLALGDPRKVFRDLDAKVDANPLMVGSRRVGTGELFLAVVSALYRRSDWGPLAAALHSAAAFNDGAPILLLADSYTQRRANGSYGELLSANAAVNCIDRPWSTDVADYDADAKSFAVKAPTFGPALAYGSLVCAFWKAPAVDRQRVLRAAGSAPIVVIGTTEDPATPYKWAQALASQLEAGKLLTYKAQGHTSLSTPNPCVTDQVAAYLLDLKVPARDC